MRFVASMGLCLVLFPVLLAAQGASRNPVLPAPIPTNTRSFSIPFEVRADQSADPAKEIELLVSKDRGTRWYSGGRLPVDGKRFDFKAEDDGEYWFAFRTITLSGVTKQTNQGQPQIRVLVDATSPVLTLELKQQPSGEVFVQWKAEDGHLQGKRPDFAVSALSFDGKKEWKTLNVDGRNLRVAPTEIAGQFVFWPDNGVSELEVRAIISDIAGNRAEKTGSIKLAPVRRDLESILRDSLVADSEDAKNSLPDAPVQRIVGETATANDPDGSNPAWGNLSWNHSGQRVPGVPITPPKPIRIPRDQRKEIARKPVDVQTEKTVLAKEYQPAPVLNSPVDETRREFSTPVSQNEAVPNHPKQKTEDYSSDLFANMDRFFDGQLKKELDELEQNRKRISATEKSDSPERLEDGPAWPALPPKTAPAVPTKQVANQHAPPPVPAPAPTSVPENKPVPQTSDIKPDPARKSPPRTPVLGPVSPKTESPKTEPPKAEPSKDEGKSDPSATMGHIAGVSLNNTASQAQIIVKWNVGDDSWKNARVDVLRGDTSTGPWEPIATHLPNSGEYWWFLTQDDLKPFHLMVRTRNAQGTVHSDATQTPIQIPAEMIGKK